MKVSRVTFEKLNQQIHFCSCGNRCLFCMCAFKWDMVVVILKWCLYLWGAYFYGCLLSKLHCILLTKFCMYWVKLVDCVIPCVVINPRRACAVRVAVRGLLVILSVWSVCPVKLFQLHSGLNA